MTDPLPPGSAETRWIRSDRTLFRWVPEGVVVLVLPDGEPELVTGPGGELWELLEAPSTLDELTDALAERYRHDPDVVRRDLGRALDDLHERDIVVALP